MRKWTWLLATGFFLLLSACGGQPQIMISETTIQLGDVVNGQIIERDLRVENTGEAALTIDAVTTSCGCTQASIELTTIPPGGSGTLHIEFDSGAHGPALTGELIRQVFVVSNDPQQPELMVELSANILSPAAP
jgi:hypothetical protein